MTTINPIELPPPVHVLKCWPEFFAEVIAGRKTFEIRYEDDRTFNVGDSIQLREYDPKTDTYSGRTCAVAITYKTNWMQKDGVVVLAIEQDRARPVPGTIRAMEDAAESFIKEYEFDDGDGAVYTPSEFEHLMIADAIHGLLADDDFCAAIRQALRQPAVSDLLQQARRVRNYSNPADVFDAVPVGAFRTDR